MAGNWKMNLNHQEAVVLVQKLAWTLAGQEARLRPGRGRRRAAVHRPALRADAGRRRPAAGPVRRAGRLRARLRRLHRRDLGRRCSPSSAAPTSSSATPSAASTTRETDEVVNAKAHKALAAGMTPIVCVGEGLEVRQAGDARAALPRPGRRLAGRLHRRAGRRPGHRLRAGLGDRHRRGRHPRRRAGGLPGDPRPGPRGRTATRRPTASASSTAARSRRRTSPASWRRPTSTAAWWAARACRSTSSAASAGSTTCRSSDPATSDVGFRPWNCSSPSCS